ncbi:MAG: response regulator, partial [Pyrinomonadaceae bacterium]
PDVLVSDLAMPDEDGYSLIAKIRATEQGSKVLAVALTAYVRIEDRARAFSAGYNMFVPKPGRTNGVGNRHRQPGERGKLRIAAIHSGVVPS